MPINYTTIDWTVPNYYYTTYNTNTTATTITGGNYYVYPSFGDYTQNYWKGSYQSPEYQEEIKKINEIAKQKELEEQEKLKNEPTAFIIFTNSYLLDEERFMYDSREDANDYINYLCRKYKLFTANFIIYEIYMKFFESGRNISKGFDLSRIKSWSR